VVLSFGNEELHQPAAIHGGVGSEHSWLPLVTGFGLSYSGNQPPASIKPRAGDVTLRFADGAVDAVVGAPDGLEKAPPRDISEPRPRAGKKAAPAGTGRQQDLFSA